MYSNFNYSTAIEVPEDYTGTVTYSSSNEDVATVDQDGLVSIIGLGTADITITTSETEIYAANKYVYTLELKDNPLHTNNFLLYDKLAAAGLIDEVETEKINTVLKYKEYNRFSATNDDLTEEELKNFRTWLATTLYTILGDDVNNNIKWMLNFYKEKMNDDTVQHLEEFNVSSAAISNITIAAQSNCACNTKATTVTNNISSCDSVSLYKKAVYNVMVETFSQLSFWEQFENEFLKEFKKYIDGIIKKNYKLYTSDYASDLYDCSCLTDSDSKQIRAISVLNSLSNALGYMIKDDNDENNITGHKNEISIAFNNWATGLYEKMQW